VWNISYYYARFLFDETPIAWSLIMIAAHIALLLSVQIGLRKLRQVDMWSVAVSTLALGLQATIVVVTTLVHTIAEFKTVHDYWMVIMFFSAAATFVIFGVCATYLWKLRSNDSLPSLDSASPPRNEDSPALEQSTEVHPSAKQ
jgi:hypothetical protein